MKTRIIRIDINNIDNEKINLAAKIIKKGGLVGFPTETVYGLGANALDAKAVKKIFEVKKRPSDDPIIIHVSSPGDVYKLAREVPDGAKKLMKKFWPGPLTLVLKKSEIVQGIVTSGLDTVAIRMPSHPVAHSLIKTAKTPIAAPSANLFGKPSPTSAEHVKEDLDGKIDIILDSGETNIGVESTVIDLTSNIATVLRPGGITLEELEKVLGKVKLHPAAKAEKKKIKKFKSPGMIDRHYAPDADVIVIEGKTKEDVKRKIQELAEKYKQERKKVGIMITDKNSYDADIVKFVGKNLDTIAKNLFKTLREFDKEKVDIIIVEGVKTKGLGLAIMNRLKKAACHNIVKV
jgi:L-threonylcarbamoyladenylate synthase